MHASKERNMITIQLFQLRLSQGWICWGGGGGGGPPISLSNPFVNAITKTKVKLRQNRKVT
jgi:hypothetical protein